MSLTDRLRERIAREGPISFRDFMAAALYDAEEGYYSRGASIGERGDFVTSPWISPAFARSLARRFAAQAREFEGALDFVEVGAGEGKFLEEFSAALEANDPDVFERVRLTAVERSAGARQTLLRRPFPRGLRALDSPKELPEGSVNGWIFSNELYDALPVVRVTGSARGLQELRVDFESDAFVWRTAAAPDAYREHLERYGVAMEAGQVGEISFGAAPLHRILARALGRGSLVSFDYGHRSPVLYHATARRHGTLAVHFAGLRRGDPLSRPGQVDLTAHVHWDLLIEAGEAEGLTTEGISRQGRFLVESGVFDFTPDDASRWRAYRLVDPEGMGDEISVLVQSRGVAAPGLAASATSGDAG
ncbi:MAG: SAM-dependent methyltransferase [Acidobacteriota bacterium]|nr:SAM-dependent methyltransferase [Acidobacteriota bacterium]